MSGRFTLTTQEFEALAELLGVEADPDLAEHYRPRYNVAPSDLCLVLRGGDEGRELFRALWGMGSGKPRINVRSESRLGPRTARCAVPADGFFEWTERDGKRQPVWYRRPGGQLLLFAGIWEDSDLGPRFAILTAPANPDVAPIHDRMPVILPEDPRAVDAWLAGGAVDPLRRPPPGGTLVPREVSRRVNTPLHDDPSVLEPPEPADPPPDDPQLKLL
jgi:putative SOS response-associated peptidase YedK